jgi:hypothetical protein
MTGLISALVATATALVGIGIATAKGDIFKSAPWWVVPALFVVAGILYVLALALGIIHSKRERNKELPTPPPPPEGSRRLPEHRPRVIPTGYGKNKEQKSYSSYGLFVRNPGYDALEVQIPDAVVGLSGYTLVFPERLSLLCERDHIRFIESFLEHEMMPGVDGGHLHEVMRKANVELFSFAIYYQDTGFVWYRTNCTVERTNRTRNGLEVRAISQELTAPPVQASAPQSMPKAAEFPRPTELSEPSIYLKKILDDWQGFTPCSPFVIQNLGGSVAHEIEIKVPELAHKHLVLPVVDHLIVGSPEVSVVPTGDGWQSIYNAMVQEWEQIGLGQTVGEVQEFLIKEMAITYKDRSKHQVFETKIRLEFSPSIHLIRRNHGQTNDYAGRLDPLKIAHTSFTRLS